MTPDHPAEDAREARLSEGEVERLRKALWCDRDVNLPMADPLGVSIRDVVAALAPVVADMLTQREREVLLSAADDIVAEDWWDPDWQDQYAVGDRDGKLRVVEWLRSRALGGTTDGQDA